MPIALRAVCVAAAFALALVSTGARAESPFTTWAAVVIAGDWQKRGQSIWGYDNARRDVSKALVSIGFDPSRVRQFSSKPQWFTADKPEETDEDNVRDALSDMVDAGAGGCLFYLTTQGRKNGEVWLGDDKLSPAALRGILDRTCGERPTIVVISACYSGGFVPALEGPQRFVFTSSRADRVSFGCGVETYPYFDGCFIEAVPQSGNFPALVRAVQDCVARRERETNVRAASEPQLAIGAAIGPVLETSAFRR